MDEFRFKFGDTVKLKASQQSAEVIGRSQAVGEATQYRLLYVNKAGEQVDQWWADHSIS